MAEQAHGLAVAAQFVRLLWPAILAAGGPRPATQQPVHLGALFDADWLEALPLPIDGDRRLGQSVALVEGANFRRSRSEELLEREYHDRPRTRVYEGFGTRSDGWFSLVALQLARLARCRTVCSLYESAADDRTMGEHIDEWFGVVVQMRGAKRWFLRENQSSEPQEILLKAGDVLLLPEGVFHDVSTPEISVHLLFALVTSESFA